MRDLLKTFEADLGTYLGSRAVFALVNVFFNGELAVAVFWFLSGYVISIKLFEGNANYLIAAIAKRYFRLAIPVLGSVLFAYSLMRFGWMYNDELSIVLHGNKDSWLGSLFDFEPNLLGALKAGLWDTFFQPGIGYIYNPVLWTMNPELFGSFLCFVIHGALNRTSIRYILVFVAIVAGLYFLKAWIISFMLRYLLSEIDFGGGLEKARSVLRYLFQGGRQNAVMLVLTIVCGGFPDYYGLSYPFVSAAIVIIVIHGRVGQRFLASRAAVWLGRISFSAYLLHLPIICSLGAFLYLQLPFAHPLKVAISVLVVVVSTLVISHYYARYVDRLAITQSNVVGQNAI